MHLTWRGFKVALILQGVLLAVAFVLWYYARTKIILAHPEDGDLYANTWGFQIMVGALYFVGTALCSVALFLVEAGVFSVILRIVGRHQSSSAPGPN